MPSEKQNIFSFFLLFCSKIPHNLKVFNIEKECLEEESPTIFVKNSSVSISVYKSAFLLYSCQWAAIVLTLFYYQKTFTLICN